MSKSKRSKRTAGLSGAATVRRTNEARFVGPTSSGYRTVFVHNVDADDVPQVIEGHRPFADHAIMPEEDGEFTLIFIYRLEESGG